MVPLLARFLTVALVLATQSAAGAGAAREHLAFSNRFASDCTRHRAQMRLIENTHAQRAIEVTLWSWLGDTRSQGRSVKTLAPDAEPVALGCTGANGLKRRWEIQKAEFVD